jgi:hypothetical protein
MHGRGCTGSQDAGDAGVFEDGTTIHFTLLDERNFWAGCQSVSACMTA